MVAAIILKMVTIDLEPRVGILVRTGSISISVQEHGTQQQPNVGLRWQNHGKHQLNARYFLNCLLIISNCCLRRHYLELISNLGKVSGHATTSATGLTGKLSRRRESFFPASPNYDILCFIRALHICWESWSIDPFIPALFSPHPNS